MCPLKLCVRNSVRRAGNVTNVTNACVSRVVLRSLHGNDISELPDGIFNDAASLSHLWVKIQTNACLNMQTVHKILWALIILHSSSGVLRLLALKLQFREPWMHILCLPRACALGGQSVCPQIHELPWHVILRGRIMINSTKCYYILNIAAFYNIANWHIL